MNDRWVVAASILLACLGLGVCAVKVRDLGLPLVPERDAVIWTIEARAKFRARAGGPLQARLVIPNDPPGYEILNEDFVSSNYGVSTEVSGLNRSSLWAIRRASGLQTVYYRLSVLPDGTRFRHSDPFPGYPPKPEHPEALGVAIQALLDEVRDSSADIASFTRVLIQRLNSSPRIGAVDMLNDAAVTPDIRARQIVDILAGARIPARVVRGIMLEDGIRDGQLVPWIEVHNEQAWLPFDPMTGNLGYPSRFFVWQIGDEPLLALEGARAGEIHFAITRSFREVVHVAAQRARSAQSLWMDFSLFSLPVQTQNVYRILLTVPLGAFLVVLLRTFVGVQTFGTFMPVLMALAFRETRLIWGITLFVVIVALGLGIRFSLERLKLLLVPRLTSVLTVVILLMVAVSITTFRLGLDRGISVALFPMVILAMTIERMSLVWEELGGRTAILQGCGSLAVASLGYFVISNEYLGHLVFVFPELLLLVLAGSLLAGRYTGYRLSEIWRFRTVWTKPGDAS